MVFSLLSSGHSAKNKQCVYTALIAKKDVSAQIIANEQKVFVWGILKTVLLFEKIKTPDIGLTHNLRRSFNT